MPDRIGQAPPQPQAQTTKPTQTAPRSTIGQIGGPNTAVPCAKPEVFAQTLNAMGKSNPGPAVTFTVVKGPVCQDGLAGAVTQDRPVVFGQLLMVLRATSGDTWQHQVMDTRFTSRQCQEFPAAIRELFASVQGC